MSYTSREFIGMVKAALPHEPDEPCTCSGYPNCPIDPVSSCTGNLVGCICDLDLVSYLDVVRKLYYQGGVSPSVDTSSAS